MCCSNFDLDRQKMGGLKMIGRKGDIPLAASGCNAGISGAEEGWGRFSSLGLGGKLSHGGVY